MVTSTYEKAEEMAMPSKVEPSEVEYVRNNVVTMVRLSPSPYIHVGQDTIQPLNTSNPGEDLSTPSLATVRTPPFAWTPIAHVLVVNGPPAKTSYPCATPASSDT